MCDSELKDNCCCNEDCAAKDVDVSTLEGWAANVEVEDALDVLKVMSTAYQDLRAYLGSLDQAIREGFTNIQVELGTLGNALLDKGVLNQDDLMKAQEKIQQSVIEAREKVMEEMKKASMEGEQGSGEQV